MAKIQYLAANGLVVTKAAIRVAATSKPDALMRALDAISADSKRNGYVYSIETYTVKQDAGTNLWYIVTVE